MNRDSRYKNKLLSSLIAGVLAFSFLLAPVSESLSVRKAHADADDGANIASLVENAKAAIGSLLTATGIGALVAKEKVLDGIAWQLINIVVKEMIRSVTQWVRSGFQGSPAFVTDLSGFLLDIGDKVAGNYIWGNTNLQFLCSPFSLNIRLALDLQYRETRGYQAMCRLSGVVGNIQSFMNGGFIQGGGWNAWHQVALIPDNNPYGAMMKAEQGLYVALSGAQQNELKLLDFGSGFFSVEECMDSDMGGQECKKVTPGVVVQNQLNSALNLPMGRLAVADEINELIGALLSQLGKEVLGGVGGLLGLNESRNGQPSYFDQTVSERDTLGYANTSNNIIESSLKDEREHQGYQMQLVNMITDARTYKNRIYGEERQVSDGEGGLVWVGRCASGELTSSLQSKLVSAQQEASIATLRINELTILLNDYTLLANTATPQTSLNTLFLRYGGTTVPATQVKLMDRYQNVVAQGSHGVSENVTLRLTTVPDTQLEVQAFTSSIDRACQRSNDGGG